MQNKPSIEAILFDFDGTIIDTETPDFLAWREFYAAHQLDLGIGLWMQRVGKSLNAADMFHPAVHFEQITGVRIDQQTLDEHQRRYLEFCRKQPVLPGVMELLEFAIHSGIKLGLASNSDRDWVTTWLQHLQLTHYFECIYTVEDVAHPKPHPELYLAAAHCLGVAVERCIAIEDSPTGMQAVIAAGIRCIAVPNYLTAHLERPPVSLTLSSLAETTPAALLAQFS